jgi:hypothetical protein
MEEELSSSSYFHLDNYRLVDHIPPATIVTLPPLTTSPQDVEEEKDIKRIRRSIQKKKLSKITKESTTRAAQRIWIRNNSIRKIQFTWRRYHKTQQLRMRSQLQIQRWIIFWMKVKQINKMNQKAALIQQRWRSYRFDQEQKSLLRFSQGGKWQPKVSHLVLGLILGHLTRSRMKDPLVTKSYLSLRDAWTVLEGLVTDMTVEKLIFLSVHNSPQQVMNQLKTIDWPFARMFIKQVLVSRGVIWDHMIGCRRWSRLPSPGHWYFPQQQQIHSTKLILRKESGGMGRQLRETNSGSELCDTPSDVQIKQRPSNPQSLSEILKAKEKVAFDPRTKLLMNERLEETPLGGQTIETQRARERDGSYSQRPATAPSQTMIQPPPSVTIAPMISMPKRRKVNPLKPHLQLDLISADKLVPVKGKVPATSFTLPQLPP